MYGKWRPLAILWYQLHVSGGFHFQVHRGSGNHPLGKTCYKKRLGKTRAELNLSIRNVCIIGLVLNGTTPLTKNEYVL